MVVAMRETLEMEAMGIRRSGMESAGGERVKMDEVS